MAGESSNKRIVKNTGYLYVRMLFVMGVTLFTSRVVLDKLGVDDYGLYNVVGGIVVMLSFLNNCASGATSRFLTFALGSREENREHYDFKQVFSTAFYIHTAIALVIIILAETVGLWYFNRYLVIPEGRYGAAMWVYQISILTVLVSFTQVPYNAAIIAHERMNIYAYVGIYEALMKLAVAYAISITSHDRLKLYAVLLFFVTLSISLFYRGFCVKKIGNMCRLTRVSDKSLYKKLLSYSGWDLIGNFGASAQSQGVNLILNFFCGPAVNAARAVAFQVESALYQFTQSFIAATKPVIIKKYASGEVDESMHLLFSTAKFAFLLFSCLAAPVIIESKTILHIWLKNPPEYAAMFLRFVLIRYMFVCFCNVIITGVHAAGDAKRLNIFAGTKVFVEVPLIWLAMKAGFSPSWAFVISLVATFVIQFVDLLVLKWNVPQVSFKYYVNKVLLLCIGIIAVPFAAAYVIHLLDFNVYLRLAAVCVVYWGLVIPPILKWGVSRSFREKIFAKVKSMFA